MRKIILSVVALTLAGLVSAQANLLTNPGFETDGGTGDWASTPGGWVSWGTAANREGWAAQPTIGGSYGCAFYGWTTDGYGGLRQEVSQAVGIGEVVSFSVNLECESNFTSASDELWMKLEFFEGSTMSYDTGNQSIYTAAKAAGTGSWNTYTVTWTNDAAGITMVQPMIAFGQAVDQGGDQQAVKFDNAVLTVAAVPEPVSAALLGLGIGFIYLLRRKVQK